MSVTTWRELLKEEMSNRNESFDDIVGMLFPVSIHEKLVPTRVKRITGARAAQYLDRPFYNLCNYSRRIDGQAFVVWTSVYVYYSMGCDYDYEECTQYYVKSIPRNPGKHKLLF